MTTTSQSRRAASSSESVAVVEVAHRRDEPDRRALAARRIRAPRAAPPWSRRSSSPALLPGPAIATRCARRAPRRAGRAPARPRRSRLEVALRPSPRRRGRSARSAPRRRARPSSPPSAGRAGRAARGPRRRRRRRRRRAARRRSTRGRRGSSTRSRRRRGRRRGTPPEPRRGCMPERRRQLAGELERRVVGAGDRRRAADQVGRRRRERSAADGARRSRRPRCSGGERGERRGAARVPDEPELGGRRRRALAQAAAISASGTQSRATSASGGDSATSSRPAERHLEARCLGGAAAIAPPTRPRPTRRIGERRRGVVAGWRTSVPVLGRDTRRRECRSGSASAGPRPGSGRGRRLAANDSHAEQTASAIPSAACRSTSSSAVPAGSASRSSRPRAPTSATCPACGTEGADAATLLVRPQPPADRQPAPADGGPAGDEPRRRPPALQGRPDKRRERKPGPADVSAAATAASARRERLVEVYREASGCTLCPLAQTRTKVVFGAGDADADLMFVGEAPGAEEDRAGPALRRPRRAACSTSCSPGIGLSRERRLHRQHVLKCRPAGQSRPAADRDRDLPPLPAQPGRADRAEGDRDARQLRDEADHRQPDRDHAGPRQAAGPHARRADAEGLPDPPSRRRSSATRASGR